MKPIQVTEQDLVGLACSCLAVGMLIPLVFLLLFSPEKTPVVIPPPAYCPVGVKP
jgi:hypothetical protein